MGIRMLHHRTSPARASTAGPARLPPGPVPAVAPDAGTGRVPTTVTTTVTTALRRTTAGLRRTLTRRDRVRRSGPTATPPPETPVRHLWAGLTRGCLALAHHLLPHTPPTRTSTAPAAPTRTPHAGDSAS
ncbi:hypothetical protein [Streptomyces fumanus]|uniref:hypothetical protein n=1 Tax=Streptomyces fumanus TaxID=67302 RepID=UPI0033DB9BD4